METGGGSGEDTSGGALRGWRRWRASRWIEANPAWRWVPGVELTPWRKSLAAVSERGGVVIYEDGRHGSFKGRHHR
jgi:hypothetical protein